MPNSKKHGDEIKAITNEYRDLYKKKYGLTPVVNYPLIGKLINSLLGEHSVMGLVRVIQLYFEHEGDSQVYHLPSILSAYSVNKYLPMAKLDPRLYSDAEELNKEIY